MKSEIFVWNSAVLRVMMQDGEPWFVAADVCRVLDIANSRDAVSTLDEDERITVANADGNPRAGIPHQIGLVSESGLYALVFKSRKPEARCFRKWVTSEVLPALRKSGRYEMVAAAVPVPTVRSEMSRLRVLLLSSAEAVREQRLDTVRAQQVANLAARFLETVKLEGDAWGYEKVFELQSGPAGNGVLQANSDAPPDGVLQTVPQRPMPRARQAERGVSAPPVCGEETMGDPASGAGAAVSAPGEWPDDLARLPGGGAEAVLGSGGGAVAAEGRDLRGGGVNPEPGGADF